MRPNRCHQHMYSYHIILNSLLNSQLYVIQLWTVVTMASSSLCSQFHLRPLLLSTGVDDVRPIHIIYICVLKSKWENPLSHAWHISTLFFDVQERLVVATALRHLSLSAAWLGSRFSVFHIKFSNPTIIHTASRLLLFTCALYSVNLWCNQVTQELWQPFDNIFFFVLFSFLCKFCMRRKCVRDVCREPN